jgi:hypothetical protein
MDDVTQMRIGKCMTGIIGLKSALAAAATRCQGMTDGRIGEVLLGMPDRHNYIENGLRDIYTQAFAQEYKKYIDEPITEALVRGLSIKVLGPGCKQCDRLKRKVMTVMSENGIMAGLEHVRDVVEIARLGVMGVPALRLIATFIWVAGAGILLLGYIFNFVM